MGVGTRVRKAAMVMTLAGLVGVTGTGLALTSNELDDYQTGYRVRDYLDTTAAGRLSPYTRRPALERFQERHGGRWEAYWDQATDTPVWMWGSGIDLLGPSETRSSAVELKARAFINANFDLFRVPASELTLDYAYPNGDLWYVNFHRTYEGVPVHLSNVALRFKAGRLILVSAETYPDALVDVEPQITRDQALTVAASEVPFTHAVDEIVRQPELRVYPEAHGGGVEYRLAWLVETRNAPPYGWFGYFVDAHSGELIEVWRNDRYDYHGQVDLAIDQRTVGDPIVTVAGAHNRVTLSGAGNQNSNASGHFSFSGSGGSRTLTSALAGPYVTVMNRNGASASFSGTILDEVHFTLGWTSANADAAERDTFHAVNTTNRFVATVFPGVNWLNSALTANVNLAGTCNAFWNGTTINFYRTGGGCNATGRIFDVVAHEFGHGLDQNAPGGARDGGLGEFIGDLVSFVQVDDYRVGPGFFTSGGPVRDLEDPEFNCYDPGKTEVHDAGQLLGAVVWDIMQDMKRVGITGEALKRKLLLPIAGAQFRNAWYNEMLVVDDDDGNLANGTPNQCLIYNQFKLHSCGGTRWPGLPAGDPPNCSAGSRSIFRATDVPRAIPDNSVAGALSTLSVAAGPTIDDLDVNVDIGHTAIGDLRLVLSHASTDTVSVVLHDRTGGSQDNLVTNYDRQSPSKEPLAVLNGRSAVGTWTLSVVDSKTGDVGTVRNWQIEVRPR